MCYYRSSWRVTMKKEKQLVGAGGEITRECVGGWLFNIFKSNDIWCDGLPTQTWTNTSLKFEYQNNKYTWLFFLVKLPSEIQDSNPDPCVLQRHQDFFLACETFTILIFSFHTLSSLEILIEKKYSLA